MSNSIAEPLQNVEPQPQNRLTIGFLMLWTFGTAVMLACHRAMDDSQPPTALADHHCCRSFTKSLSRCSTSEHAIRWFGGGTCLIIPSQ